MRNIVSILSIIATVGVGAVAQAQQAAKDPLGRIPNCSPPFPLTYGPLTLKAFSQGLRGSCGYIEGKNIIIDWRSAEGKTRRLLRFARD